MAPMSLQTQWERTIEQEKLHREEFERMQVQKARKKMREQRIKALLKMVETDEQWQLKSNRPNKLPSTVSAELSDIIEAGNLAFDLQEYDNALQYYSVGLESGLDGCVELLSNFAVALLLSARYEECITICKRALQMDPAFGPLYLHLARAYRCLCRYEDAVQCLTTAQLHCPAFATDIQRERFLVLVEQRDRELGPAPPTPDGLLRLLGLSQPGSPDSLLQAFRQSVLPWHPSEWAGKTVAQQNHAIVELQKRVEAYIVWSDGASFQEFVDAFDRAQSIRLSPHLRNQWTFSTSRITAAKPQSATDSQTKQVPLFSPVSLISKDKSSLTSSQPSNASSPTAMAQMQEILAELPTLRAAWTWESPLAANTELYEIIDCWKLAQGLSGIEHEEEKERRGLQYAEEQQCQLIFGHYLTQAAVIALGDLAAQENDAWMIISQSEAAERKIRTVMQSRKKRQDEVLLVQTNDGAHCQNTWTERTVNVISRAQASHIQTMESEHRQKMHDHYNWYAARWQAMAHQMRVIAQEEFGRWHVQHMADSQRNEMFRQAADFLRRMQGQQDYQSKCSSALAAFIRSEGNARMDVMSWEAQQWHHLMDCFATCQLISWTSLTLRRSSDFAKHLERQRTWQLSLQKAEMCLRHNLLIDAARPQKFFALQSHELQGRVKIEAVWTAELKDLRLMWECVMVREKMQNVSKRRIQEVSSSIDGSGSRQPPRSTPHSAPVSLQPFGARNIASAPPSASPVSPGIRSNSPGYRSQSPARSPSFPTLLRPPAPAFSGLPSTASSPRPGSTSTFLPSPHPWSTFSPAPFAGANAPNRFHMPSPLNAGLKPEESPRQQAAGMDRSLGRPVATLAQLHAQNSTRSLSPNFVPRSPVTKEPPTLSGSRERSPGRSFAESQTAHRLSLPQWPPVMTPVDISPRSRHKSLGGPWSAPPAMGKRSALRSSASNGWHPKRNVRFAEGPDGWIPGIDCLEYRKALGPPFNENNPEFRLTPMGWVHDPPKPTPPSVHNVRKLPKNPNLSAPPVTAIQQNPMPPQQPSQVPQQGQMMADAVQVNLVTSGPSRMAYSTDPHFLQSMYPLGSPHANMVHPGQIPSYPPGYPNSATMAPRMPQPAPGNWHWRS